MNIFLKYLLLITFHCVVFNAIACECPLSTLSLDECNKYEIIFKGRIISVADCGEKYGEAMFEVQELYKGNAEKEFKVLFACKDACAYKFRVGEEWIIYSRYKQIDNAFMDWCSRSRRFFKNDKEDYYTTTSGNDYTDEVKFLRDNLGLHRLLVKKQTSDVGRNSLPDKGQSLVILLISLSAILLFYFLFTKFFK